jgi:large subunit ribosomal protein L4e
MSRPLVTVYNSEQSEKGKGLVAKGSIALPDVFTSPIRVDIVSRMHNQLRMNLRQPFSVSKHAGHQTAAESWGTGRAVARIPRVPGSGTHRAGQGAFGNMCRGGRMFSPSKVWRRWMHKVKKNERRYATASALAASSVTALVMARGHKIDSLAEVPLVVSDDIQSYSTTKNAFNFLKRANAINDVYRVKSSTQLRPGKGKNRGRRYKQRIGPLIVYKENNGLVKAFRNIPGVDVASVDRLNLLQLAPGGHVGRFIIWTESAFNSLNAKYGTYGAKVDAKIHLRNGSTYRLPRSVMQNTDIEKIIQSDEVQNVIRDRKIPMRKTIRKKNPLKNLYAMVKLNPNAINEKRAEYKKKIQAKQDAEAKAKGTYKPTPHEVKVEKALTKSKKMREEAEAKFRKNVLGL